MQYLSSTRNVYPGSAKPWDSTSLNGFPRRLSGKDGRVSAVAARNITLLLSPHRTNTSKNIVKVHPSLFLASSLAILSWEGEEATQSPTLESLHGCGGPEDKIGKEPTVFLLRTSEGSEEVETNVNDVSRGKAQ